MAWLTARFATYPCAGSLPMASAVVRTAVVPRPIDKIPTDGNRPKPLAIASIQESSPASWRNCSTVRDPEMVNADAIRSRGAEPGEVTVDPRDQRLPVRRHINGIGDRLADFHLIIVYGGVIQDL